TAFGYRKPSVVNRSTWGWSGHRESSACRMRANVDLPTATEPATPMMYGTFGAMDPRNVDDTRWRSWVALTYRWSRRDSGRYTAVTSSRSIWSLIPFSDSRSGSRNVSGVAARSIAQSSRENVKYLSDTNVHRTLGTCPHRSRPASR